MKDKVVIITGASQGLGRELSIQLAKLGAKVALVARKEKLLSEVKKIINDEGGVAEYFVCDVTDVEAINTTVSKIMNTFKTVDVLINNAGIWTTTEFENNNVSLIEKAFKTNSMAPIYMTNSVMPILKKNNYGQVINVVSKAGLDIPDNKDWPVYAATKWAVHGYTKALQYSLSGTKIRVSGFFPGGFESNIFETLGEKDAHNQPWMMRTEDVAKAVIYIINQPDDVYINSIGMSNI